MTGKFDGLFKDYRSPKQKLKDRATTAFVWIVILILIGFAGKSFLEWYGKDNKAYGDKVRASEQQYNDWVTAHKCVRTGFVSGERGKVHSVYRCAGDVVTIDYEIISFINKKEEKK